MAVTWKKLAYESDVVLKTDFNAYSILYADTDNTPTALTVGASTVVGRKASGGIAALTKAELLAILNVEDGADVTDATNVAGAGAVMESDFTAAGDLLVGTGESTATILPKGSASQVLRVKTDGTTLEWASVPTGTGDFLADGTVAMTGDLQFAGNHAKDMVIQEVANEAAVAAYAAPVLGKVLFATSEKTLHICTSAA